MQSNRFCQSAVELTFHNRVPFMTLTHIMIMTRKYNNNISLMFLMAKRKRYNIYNVHTLTTHVMYWPSQCTHNTRDVLAVSIWGAGERTANGHHRI